MATSSRARPATKRPTADKGKAATQSLAPPPNVTGSKRGGPLTPGSGLTMAFAQLQPDKPTGDDSPTLTPRGFHSGSGDDGLDFSDDEMAMKEGWLYVLGQDRRTWKRRWVSLKGKCVYWYDDQSEAKFLGVMPLRGAKVLDWGKHPVRKPPEWRQNPNCSNSNCNAVFSLFTRQHHCRHCGFAFCDKHSSETIEIPYYGFDDAVRVCDRCFRRVNRILRHAKIATASSLKQTTVGAKGMAQLHKRFHLPEKSSRHPHLFAVKTKQAELWLESESKRSREEWVAAVRRCQASRGSPGSAPEADPGETGEGFLLDDPLASPTAADSKESVGPMSPPSQWTVEEVQAWLCSIHLPQYRPLFARQRIDGAKLCQDAAKLVSTVGMDDVSHQQWLLHKLSERLSTPAPSIDPSSLVDPASSKTLKQPKIAPDDQQTDDSGSDATLPKVDSNKKDRPRSRRQATQVAFEKALANAEELAGVLGQMNTLKRTRSSPAKQLEAAGEAADMASPPRGHRSSRSLAALRTSASADSFESGDTLPRPKAPATPTREQLHDGAEASPGRHGRHRSKSRRRKHGKKKHREKTPSQPPELRQHQPLSHHGRHPTMAVAPPTSALQGSGTWRRLDKHVASVGRRVTVADEKGLISPHLPGFAFRAGEAVAFLDPQRDARVVGVIKRKVFVGEQAESKYEVQVTDTGEVMVFSAEQLLKFQQYEVQWQKGKLIGKGAYGKVWNGLNMKDGRLIAIKEMDVEKSLGLEPKKGSRARPQRPAAVTPEMIGAVTPEISLMQMLEHPNIVRFLGSEVDGSTNTLYIFMEKVSGGSLKTLLDNYGPLPESVIITYTRQILAGLSYLHRNCVVHRDLKGSNVLITTEGIVKLADFGVSKKVASSDLQELGFLAQDVGHNPVKLKQRLQGTNLQTMIGSPYWMAPEVVTQAGYGRKADIWSLGCTIVEMATAEIPWKGYNQIAACFVIGESDKLPDIPPHLSAEAQDFIRLCLNRNKDLRPSADELLQHPWLAQPERSISP